MGSKEGIVGTGSFLCLSFSKFAYKKWKKKKPVKVMSLVFSFVYSNIRISSLTHSKVIILKIQSSDTPVQCDVWSFLHKWNPTNEIHSFCTKGLCFHLISTLCSKRKMQYHKWRKVTALKEKVKFAREVWVPLLGEVNYGKSACYLLFGENAVLEERVEGGW